MFDGSTQGVQSNISPSIGRANSAIYGYGTMSSTPERHPSKSLPFLCWWRQAPTHQSPFCSGMHGGLASFSDSALPTPTRPASEERYCSGPLSEQPPVGLQGRTARHTHSSHHFNPGGDSHPTVPCFLPMQVRYVLVCAASFRYLGVGNSYECVCSATSAFSDWSVWSLRTFGTNTSGIIQLPWYGRSLGLPARCYFSGIIGGRAGPRNPP